MRARRGRGRGVMAQPPTQLPERSSLAGELGGRPARRNDDDSCNLRIPKNLRILDENHLTTSPGRERSSLAVEEGGRSAPRKDDGSCNNLARALSSGVNRPRGRF